MGARSAEPASQEGAQAAHRSDPDQVRGRRLTDDSSAARGRYGLPRGRRVTRGSELDVLRREGKRVRTEHLDVRVLASLPAFPGTPASAPGVGSQDAGARVGIIVPKHRHSGVERNRLKRRLRELARLQLLPVLPAGAVLLRARPEAYAATFAALARDVERAAREAVRWVERAAVQAAAAQAPSDVSPPSPIGPGTTAP